MSLKNLFRAFQYVGTLIFSILFRVWLWSVIILSICILAIFLFFKQGKNLIPIDATLIKRESIEVGRSIISRKSVQFYRPNVIVTFRLEGIDYSYSGHPYFNGIQYGSKDVSDKEVEKIVSKIKTGNKIEILVDESLIKRAASNSNNIRNNFERDKGFVLLSEGVCLQ